MRNLSFILLLVMVSCNTASPDNEELKSENTGGNEQAAKDWLMKAIPDFFESTEMDLNTIATPEYAEYKSDAMNILYGELTIPMFEQKWKGKFDVSDNAVGKAFLIDGEDYVKIEVVSCELISTSEKGWKFSTKLIDKAMNMEVARQIDVIPFADAYRISDVK